MNEVSSSIHLQVPPERTWEILSDLTAMKNYMPGIKNVELVSDSPTGVGASRHCTFEDGVELTERVTDWQPEIGYTLETVAVKGVPMRSNVITFRVAPGEDGTVIEQSMRYAMKGGILAPLMEILAKGMMRKAIRGALEGLKRYAET